jgi:hypothetical protein
MVSGLICYYETAALKQKIEMKNDFFFLKKKHTQSTNHGDLVELREV